METAIKLTDGQGHLIGPVLDTLPDGEVIQVCIGIHWTAVVVEVEGEQHAGLASTFGVGHTHGEADIPQAGRLEELSGRELARLALGEKDILRSIGIAAVNALLPRRPETWEDINAEHVILRAGIGKSVGLVGHFPFIPRIRPQVGELFVFEQRMQPGDLAAESVKDVLPHMDVVAITGTTLINHTLEGLLALCAPQALVILLGPSTVLSPQLFERGIDLLCGAVVTDIPPVLKTVQQGGNFPQVHHAGVRLVSVKREGADI